jgi:hypothetical protein
MNLNPETGELAIPPHIRIFPRMTFAELNTEDIAWEVWITHNSLPVAYRTIINDHPNKGEKLILITYFSADQNRELTEWNLKPIGKFTGAQKTVEGKHTKKARAWFKDKFHIELPINRPWGSIDAAYDVHNSSTLIIYNR